MSSSQLITGGTENSRKRKRQKRNSSESPPGSDVLSATPQPSYVIQNVTSNDKGDQRNRYKMSGQTEAHLPSSLLTIQSQTKHWFDAALSHRQHNHDGETPQMGAEFFSNASNFAFNAPVNMVSNTVESFESTRDVIKHLAAKSVVAAIHNSHFRAYPPRCHEETRKSIRGDIVEWSGDPSRRQRVRWFFGPAGVGKSAIAQSVAEELARVGRLGATFFFSRPGKVDDPDTVVPTLAYQLATRHPRYKRLITECLGNDPLILEMDRSTQFRALISEPFQIIALEDESSVNMPLLVVVDGLDECRDKAAQCEFIRLIGDIARIEKSSLLWMICSRPEWHLRSLLADGSFPIDCHQEEIAIEDEEAQSDAEYLLCAGLDKIRRQNHLPPGWPPHEQVGLIARVASGHLGFVSFILRFIETSNSDNDEDDGDAGENFDLCVKVVSGSAVDLEGGNPLEALDRLYHQVLSKVPSRVLPTTMRILGVSVLYSGYELTVHDQARFLDINQASFYRSLKQLYSVVDVPSVAEAIKMPLHFYHASFSDFLRDSARSHDFFLDEGAVHLDVAVHSLPWLGRGQSEKPPGLVRESWGETHFSTKVVWKACSKVPKELSARLMDVLDRFDFGNLQRVRGFGGPKVVQDFGGPQIIRADNNSFEAFIRWLYTQGPRTRSLISVVDKGQIGSRRTLNINCAPQDPEEFCAALSLNINKDQLPMTLHFVLGYATQIQVSLHLLPPRSN